MKNLKVMIAFGFAALALSACGSNTTTPAATTVANSCAVGMTLNAQTNQCCNSMGCVAATNPVYTNGACPAATPVPTCPAYQAYTLQGCGVINPSNPSEAIVNGQNLPIVVAGANTACNNGYNNGYNPYGNGINPMNCGPNGFTFNGSCAMIGQSPCASNQVLYNGQCLNYRSNGFFYVVY